MATQILSVTSVATLLGQQVLNRWDFVDTSGAAVPGDIVAPFMSDVITPYAAWVVDDMGFTELRYRVITNPLAPQQIHAISPVVNGSDASEAGPPFVAATIRWIFGPTVVLTAEVPQRRIRRGGKRIAGLGEDRMEGNNLAAASVAGLAAIAEGYIGMTAAGWVPCIAGLPVQPDPLPHPSDPLLQVPNKYALIEAYNINSYLGSQVSRKFGHGS